MGCVSKELNDYLCWTIHGECRAGFIVTIGLWGGTYACTQDVSKFSSDSFLLKVDNRDVTYLFTGLMCALSGGISVRHDGQI